MLSYVMYVRLSLSLPLSLLPPHFNSPTVHRTMRL